MSKCLRKKVLSVMLPVLAACVLFGCEASTVADESESTRTQSANIQSESSYWSDLPFSETADTADMLSEESQDSAPQSNILPDSMPSDDSLPPEQTASETAEQQPTEEEQRELERQQLLRQVHVLLGEEDALLEELQVRADSAAAVEELQLTGLSFPARCALLMLWELQYENISSCYCLADITLDSCPEIISQRGNQGDEGGCFIYDLSGEYAYFVRMFYSGIDGDQSDPDIDRTGDIPAGKYNWWQISSTVFPDGSTGGIIDTVGVRWHDTYYFTDPDGAFPLSAALEVSASAFGPRMRRYYLETRQYDPLSEEETWVYLTPYDESPLWDFDTMTHEDFLEAIKGTYFETLRNLPRLPWSSPQVRVERMLTIEGHGEPVTLPEIWQIAQELCDKYNEELAKGNY